MATTLSAPPTQTVVAHPSKLVPGIPPFVFAVPPGWVLDEAAGALAVIRQPAEVDGFWINAILSHDKVARSIGFREAATITWSRLLAKVPDARMTQEKFLQVDGKPMFLRFSEMTGGEPRRPIAQLHAIFFAPVTGPGQVVDFFQIVCTVPSEMTDTYGPQLVDFIRSFKFI